MRILRTLNLFMLAACALSAQAESKNELGLLLGRIGIAQHTLASGEALKFNTGTALQATYARRILKGGVADLLFEVPFVATPSNDIRATNPALPRLVASILVTPGVRVKFLPHSRISPWLSVGGGYARFDPSKSTLGEGTTLAAPGSNGGALALGGGVDVKFWRIVGLRGEVRDFYSGLPNYGVTLTDSRRNSVVVSGGFVLHF